MKQVIFIILTLFVLLTTVNSQNAKPSKETIRDFSVSFYYKYKFEKNESLQASAYLAGNRLGYSLSDIQVAVEKMEIDKKFREELLKVMMELQKSDEEFFTLNLISIGMKATNAKELAKYIYQTYDGSSIVNTKQEYQGIPKSAMGSENENKQYVIVRQEAKYIGGQEALIKYLEEALNYPDTAYKNNIEGIVKIKFLIDTDGTVKNAEILEGAELGYGLPEEALRLITQMPKWKPAAIDVGGKPLKSWRAIPITFRIPETDGVREPKDNTVDASNESSIKLIPPTHVDATTNQQFTDKKGTFLTAYSTLKSIYTSADLIKIYGSRNIQERDAYDNEGTLQGKDYVLYPNTKNEVVVRFENNKRNQISIKNKNSEWKLPYSLYVGMSLKEVIAANGRDFKIYGFEWDYSGGLASWENGNLQSIGTLITLAAPDNVNYSIYSKFFGEKQYNTSNPELRRLGLSVEEITFRNIKNK